MSLKKEGCAVEFAHPISVSEVRSLLLISYHRDTSYVHGVHLSVTVWSLPQWGVLLGHTSPPCANAPGLIYAKANAALKIFFWMGGIAPYPSGAL